MLADEAGERLAQKVQLAVLHEHRGALSGELGGHVIDGADDGLIPERRGDGLEGVEGAAVLGGGHPVEQLPELEPLIPKGRLGEFALDHGEAGGLPQVVAEEDGLQRERGLRALMAGDFRVQGRDGFGDNGGLVVKVVHVLEQVGSLGEAGFEARRVEALVRSTLDGLAVLGREKWRPVNEQSPKIVLHETDRAKRLLNLWEQQLNHPLFHGQLNMVQIVFGCTLGFADLIPEFSWRSNYPKLLSWFEALSARPSFLETKPPLHK